MTAEIPHDRQQQPDPLEALRASAIDPALADVLDNALEAQGTLQSKDTLNWKIVTDTLKPVNDLWASTDYPGTLGRFTGKVRECFEGAKDNPSIAILLKNLPSGTDEHGEYWVANDLELVCAYFTVATGEENELDEDARVGLSLIAPDDYDDDIEIEEGELILYSDEIERASFARPNAVTIERQLAYHFPELHRKLMQMLPDSPDPSSRAITQFIREFYIPADESLYHDYPITERLGAYIFSKFEFDDELYEVSIKGPVHSIDADEKEIDTYADKYHHYSLRGIVAGILMQHDDEMFDDEVVYRPHLLLAVPEPVKGGGYYPCIIPPETLIGLRSLRNRRTQFGKTALLSFERVADITEYFAEPMMLEEVAQSEIDSDELDSAKVYNVFSEITKGFENELPHFLSYNKDQEHHVISVARDLSRIVKDFNEHTIESGKADPDTPLSLDDYTKIEKKMLASYDHLQDIAVGDTVATRGEVLAIDAYKDEPTNVISLHANLSLQGQFQGFKVLGHPVIAIKPGVGMEAIGETVDVNICVILSDCKVVNEAGVDQSYAFNAERILLPVTTANTDHFVKLETTKEGE